MSFFKHQGLFIMSTKRVKKIIAILFFTFLGGQLYAQIIDQKEDFLFKKKEQQNLHLSKPQLNYASLDLSEILIEPIQSWSFSSEADPKLNFNYFGIPQVLGDINGDGKTDYFTLEDRVMDERTTDILDDRTFKTALFLGGNLSQVPDSVYYSLLIAAGDLNNDGFDDALTRKEFSISFTENERLQIMLGSDNGLVETGYYLDGTESVSNSSRSVSFIDLNNDGFQDVVFRASNLIDVLFGGEAEQDMIFRSMATPGTLRNIDTYFSNYAFTVGDLDDNGSDDLIILKGAFEDMAIGVFELQPYSIYEKQIIFDFELENYFLSLKVMDINADSVNELFIGDEKGLVLEVDDNGDLINTPVIISPSYDSYPIGDLNNDSRIDFLLRDNSERISFLYRNDLKIAFGKENLNEELTVDKIISEYQEDENWEWSSYRLSRTRTFSDFDGDGIHDTIISHYEDSTDKSGKRLILGSESGEFESKFILEDNDKLYSTVFEVVGVGDVNNDQIDDFAFAKFSASEVHVFFGGEIISDVADIILKLDFKPKKIIKGDFNGDTIEDILVGDNEGKKANIYHGGGGFNSIPDQEMQFENMIQNDEDLNVGLHFPENIGDYNLDGADDFIFNDSRQTVFLFFGGTEISSIPAYTINLADELNTEFPNGFSFANSSLGDIDNDGFNDFGVANYNYINENGTKGAVFVFLGKEDESPELLKLSLPDSLSKISNFGYGLELGGDLNHDGFDDIIVSSRFAYENSPKIFSVFYGGDNFDAYLDSSFSINRNLVGSFNRGYEDDYVIDFRGEVNTLDFEEDGRDEVIIIPSTTFIYPVIIHEDETILKLNVKNTLEPLGNYYLFDNSAIGDFNNDGNLEIVLPQVYDNNDLYSSSRVYMYSLNRFLVGTEEAYEPKRFKLNQNYPNPFNPATKINFSLPRAGTVSLKVFNVLGQEVADLIDGRLNAGIHTIDFNATGMPSGVYFYRIEAGDIVFTKQMMLIK